MGTPDRFVVLTGLLPLLATSVAAGVSSQLSAGSSWLVMLVTALAALVTGGLWWRWMVSPGLVATDQLARGSWTGAIHGIPVLNPCWIRPQQVVR